MMEAYPDTTLQLSISIWLGIAPSQKPWAAWLYMHQDTPSSQPHATDQGLTATLLRGGVIHTDWVSSEMDEEGRGTDDTMFWPWGQPSGTSVFWESHSLQRQRPKVQVTQLRCSWLPSREGQVGPSQLRAWLCLDKPSISSFLVRIGHVSRLTLGAEATWFWSVSQNLWYVPDHEVELSHQLCHT